MVVIRQVRFAKEIPPGIRVDNVIKVPLNPQLGQQFYSFIDELESHTSVQDVTAGQKNPINEDYKTNIDWVGRDPSTHPLVRYTICLSNFPEFFGHDIMYGRLYSDTIRADLSRFLVNKLLGDRRGNSGGIQELSPHFSAFRDPPPCDQH